MANLSLQLYPFRHLEGSLAWGSSVVQHIRQIEAPSPAGVLLCRSVCQALKGAPWAGSYSVVQCVPSFMGQPLYCSAANAGVWGERG